MSSAVELSHHAMIATSMNGLTKLVMTSATKNSRNLTSENGENQQLNIATIVGNLITLWKMAIGMKHTKKKVQSKMIANRSAL